jgi:hypothetical protein
LRKASPKRGPAKSGEWEFCCQSGALCISYAADTAGTICTGRRKAVSALKNVRDLDDAAIDDGTSQDDLQSEVLEDAVKRVEAVESQARMLVGQMIGQDEQIASLKQRMRQEILQEVLDVVNIFVDPGTYQKIKQRLM